MGWADGFPLPSRRQTLFVALIKTSAMQEPSLIKHFRDIIILPFMVTFVIPYFIHNDKQGFLPNNILLKFVGTFFFIVGLFLFLWTNYLFKTFGKGTLAPWTVKQNLVIRGPYKYCRNPMITGVLFILIGETLFLHSTNILIWTCIFFFVHIFYFAFKEEPDLHRRFGDAYEKYKENVPRWIPKLRPYSVDK
jgi:protein-S-isoprenylcysteine O-methyltransferase Ste14